MKNKIKQMAACMWHKGRFLRRNQNRPVILYYHGVPKESRNQFRLQMEYLSVNYRVVPLKEVLLSERKATPATVSITFDDAFVSVFDNAVDILKTYHLPATVFVPTGWLGKKAAWFMQKKDASTTEQIVDVQRLKEHKDEDDLEFFSHTVNHAALSELDEQNLWMEIKESKVFLEDLLGKEVPVISYPYGKYNNSVIQVAQKAGYRWGLTVQPRMVNLSAPFEIGRFSVQPVEGISSFNLKANGAYEVDYYLRSFKRWCMPGRKGE